MHLLMIPLVSIKHSSRTQGLPLGVENGRCKPPAGNSKNLCEKLLSSWLFSSHLFCHAEKDQTCMMCAIGEAERAVEAEKLCFPLSEAGDRFVAP